MSFIRTGPRPNGIELSRIFCARTPSIDLSARHLLRPHHFQDQLDQSNTPKIPIRAGKAYSIPSPAGLAPFLLLYILEPTGTGILPLPI